MKIKINNLDSTILSILKKSDLKITPQRVTILKVILNQKKPFSAEDIFKQLLKSQNTFSLATIYRAFSQFSEKSIIEQQYIKGSTSTYYIFNQHPEKHRHHLICTKCKKSVSIDICPVGGFSENIADQNGFLLTGHSFEIYGVCPKCQNA